MKDIHGRAILDYYKGDRDQPLILHNSYGEAEEMPVEVFFREHVDFSEIENLAMSHCRGKVLDLGAGAGAHSLFLQALGADVVAIENSPGCVDVLRMSGMENVIAQDYRHHVGTYDTILLLMNGLGIAGKLSSVPILMRKLKKSLSPNGQIIVDSSDISYLYEDIDLPGDSYYGEVRYQYEYKGYKGDWFDWVYVDADTLRDMVTAEQMQMELLMTDENDQYLARITC